MQLEEETRTDIEELYNERIAAFNAALNERIMQTQIELDFERRQNKILRADKDYLEMENMEINRRLRFSYNRNSELKAKNSKLIQKLLL
jgi:hypothetical protein